MADSLPRPLGVGNSHQIAAAHDAINTENTQLELPSPTTSPILDIPSQSHIRHEDEVFKNPALNKNDSTFSKTKFKKRPTLHDYRPSYNRNHASVPVLQRSVSVDNLFSFSFPTEKGTLDRGNICPSVLEPNLDQGIHVDIQENRSTEAKSEQIFLQSENNELSCSICFDQDHVLQSLCCSSPTCRSCLKSHIRTQVKEGRLAIECPSCDIILPEWVIMDCLDESAKRTFHLLRKLRRRRDEQDVSPRIVLLGEEDEGNRDVDDDLSEWAVAENRRTGLANARQCPDCQIYIEKKAGCFNMKCPICGTKFCYKCGMKLPHDIAIYHKSTTVTVHRPLFTCHRCGNCCRKVNTCFLHCFSGRSCLHLARFLMCLIMLSLVIGMLMEMLGFRPYS